MQKGFAPILIVFVSFVLIGGLVGVYYLYNPMTTNSSKTRSVSWDEAVTILNSGQVNSIGQGHNLNVGISLKDGTSITTKEPSIDEIFRELEKCQVCKGQDILTIIE